ncbi:MAG: tetratricopeptide repeat protein, partial [Deltaproteobacteria bacterium]|nr:tetratricopeptide repeat protein [Deltaproteobacteria bacterium]
KKTGIVAGLMLALYPTAIFFDCLIQKAVLSMFFTTLSLLLIAGSVDRPAWGRWMALGITLGLMALTRENAMIFILLVFIWMVIYFKREPKRNVLLWAAMYGLGLAIVFLPVSLRNYVVGGDCAITTSQLGTNLYIGNNINATGTYAPLRWNRGDWRFERKDATELAEKEAGRTLSPSEVSHFWTIKTLNYVRTHPGHWIGLMAKKWHMTWNATEMSDSESQYAHYEYSVILKILGLLFHFGILCSLAFFGFFMTWSDRGRLWLLYLMMTGYAAGVALFYVFARYRYPMIAFLILFAAAGVTEALWSIRQRSFKKVALCAILTIPLALFVNWEIRPKNVFAAPTFFNVGYSLEKEGKTAEAVNYYRKSLALYPENSKPHVNLGIIAANRGEIVEAVEHFEKALAIMPGNPDAQYNLGVVMAMKGRPDEALYWFHKVLTACPEYGPEIYYNAACMYALKQDSEASIEMLKKALDRGYDNWALLKTDKDLDSIRKSPYYRELMARMK